ncbi:MAG TPA: ATP-binding protein [Candidatus Rubneribacter avistercoris]|nr:ATP-binding protein [Candidatus Rubneribacter avistercoris]
MEYKRTTYLDKLVAGMGSDQVKIITGLRRCGKSYLMNTLFKRYLREMGVAQDRIVQVDFDGFRNKALRDPSAFLAHVDERLAGEGTCYLLLDEVQLLGEFAEVLNDLIRMDNVDVYATGGNARLLSKDVVTEFRGRGTEIALRPLSFSEFMEGYDGDRRDGYAEYSLYGGLPAVAKLVGAGAKADYLKGIYDETYLRDIVERHKVANQGDLVDVLDVLCSGIGCLTNSTKIANTFKSEKRLGPSRPTIDAYITYLEDAFLFEKAARYDVKGRKYIGANSKYYATDLGLRNARMNFRQYEETHILENVIYNELRGRGFSVDVGVVPARRRSANGASERVTYEIDFVCNSGSKRCYIQSAFALPTDEKLKQEEESLMRAGDFFKRAIITKDGPMPHYNDEGILMLNVYDFLLDPNSLDL